MSHALAPPRPVAAGRRNRLLIGGLQFLLVVLALSRYDATSWVFRGTTDVDFFNWFWRFRWLGVFSFFDLALAGLLASALALDAFRPDRWRNPDGFLFVLALVTCAGLLVRLVSPSPADTTQELLFGLRNILYLAGGYAVAIRVRWTERRFLVTMEILACAAAATLVLLFIENLYLPPETRVWKYGRFAALRDVADQSFLLFAQFFLVALLLEGRPRRWWLRLLTCLAVVYSLYAAFTGTGKGTLFVYGACVAYLFLAYRLHRRPVVMAGSALSALALAGALVYVLVARPVIEPGSPFYIYTTFRGEDASVSTRRVEMANLVENLDQRGGWVWGIGLGSRWYEHVQQPEDLGAFPAAEQGQPWHLGMHVPLGRLVLDFGLCGLALLLILLAVRFRRTLRQLRRDDLQAATRAFLHAAWLAIAYELVVNSLSVPKGALLAGVLLGALAGLEQSCRGESARLPSEAS